MGNVLGRVVQGMGNRKFVCSVLLVCLLTCSPTEHIVMHAFFCLFAGVCLPLSKWGIFYSDNITSSKGNIHKSFLLFFFVQAVTLPSNVCDDWLVFGNQEMYNLRKYVLYETCVQNFVYFSSKNLE